MKRVARRLLLLSTTVSELRGTQMLNLPIPAPAMPPLINAAPGTLDTTPAGGPDSEDFSAVLARELTTALPGAAISDGQPQPPGSEMMPLQIPSEPSPAAPALLALSLGIQPDQYASGGQPTIPLKTAEPNTAGLPASDRAYGDQPTIPSQILRQHPAGPSGSDGVFGAPPIPAKALPDALPTETLAQRNVPQSARTARPALESDNTADFAAPDKFLPPVAAEEKTSRSGTEAPVPQRLPEAAPLPQMTNLAFATAASPASASAPTTESLQIDTRVGAPGWNGELAQKVVWMATQQQQVAELRLNPPHLGPVEVSLTVGNDQGAQQASIQFAAPHLATREAIESALPRLREMMADSGIALGNVTVSADSFQQQAEAGRQDRPALKQPAGIGMTATGLAGRSAVTFMPGERNGLVDTFA